MSIISMVKYYSHKRSKQTCCILHYFPIFPIKRYHFFKEKLKKIFESYCVKQFLSFLTCFFSSLPLPLLINSHILEISEMTTHARRTIVTRLRSLMDFTLRCVRFYPCYAQIKAKERQLRHKTILDRRKEQDFLPN